MAKHVPQLVEQQLGPYRLSTDPSLVDVGVVHRYLAEESYWAARRPRDVVARSIEHSLLVAGAYDDGGTQVGFGRMVTDLATFAWLCDVFVLPEHRGEGLGRSIVALLVEHPDAADVKRQILATGDAHRLYRRFGYGELDAPERWMQRSGPGR